MKIIIHSSSDCSLASASLVAIQVLLGQKPKKLRANAHEAMKKKTSGLGVQEGSQGSQVTTVLVAWEWGNHMEKLIINWLFIGDSGSWYIMISVMKSRITVINYHINNKPYNKPSNPDSRFPMNHSVYRAFSSWKFQGCSTSCAFQNSMEYECRGNPQNCWCSCWWHEL